ncbi:hypothetical protein FKM82_007009 [Ascaphus truei]
MLGSPCVIFRMSGSLSIRGSEIAKGSFLLEQGLKIYIQDPYHKDLNPQGIVNLGTSENKICFDILRERLTRPDMHYLEPGMLAYNDPRGVKRFREEIARFLTDYGHAPTSLNPEHVIVMSGCCAIICALSTVICNPGDGFLIPTPYYGGINAYTALYSGLQPVHVPLYSKVGEGESYSFQLTTQKLEAAMQKGKEQGIQIRALILINPQNPLGEIYPAQLLKECLEFGHRYNLHVIIDEIYMLSVFNNTSFTSVLSFHDVPDPERTHFIWGPGKDFAMSGFRVGMLYTRNEQVCSAMSRLAFFHQCPGPIQYMLTQLLSDRDWLENVFFPTNKQRLKDSWKMLVTGLRGLGIPVLKHSAGLYVWADLRKFLKSQTFEAEMELWRKLTAGKLYIAPGKAFDCYEPGWFRLIFSVSSDVLQLGLQRLRKLLKETPEQTLEIQYQIQETNFSKMKPLPIM